jgi:hypothetical protein
MPGRRRLPAQRQPLPLTAEHQRHPVEVGDRVVEGQGVVGGCHRQGREAASRWLRQRAVPVLQARPRQYVGVFGLDKGKNKGPTTELESLNC